MKILKRIAKYYKVTLAFIKKHFAWLALILALAFATWLMTHTLGFEDGLVIIKGKLLSDFQSHIAIIRSFSEGQNFPPEFPHFSGLPIRYHFLFYFFIGMLERAGLRLDMAVNLLSIIGMAGLLMMVYFLGTRIGKTKWIGLGAAVMVIFNSSLSWIYYFFIGKEKLASISELFKTPSFGAFGPYDNSLISAFWNLNIYTNQRHLAFAFALMFAAVWLIVYKKGWKSLVLAVIIIGTLSWVHKATWLILFIVLGVMFFAHFKSKQRIYLATLLGLGVSLPGLYYLNQNADPGGSLLNLQLGFLSNSTDWHEFNVVSPLQRFIVYWFLNLGLLPLMAFAGFVGKVIDYQPKLPRKSFFYFFAKVVNPDTAWFLAGLLVFIIANVINFGPDIANNHKLINFAIYTWSIYALVALKDFVMVFKYPVLVLFLGLILGGVCDLFPIINDSNFHLFSANTIENSNWVRKNTKATDIFLSLNGDVSFALAAGRRQYIGGPYYCWSLGYAYEPRINEIRKFRDESFPNPPFCNYLRANNISYVSYNENEKEFLYNPGYDKAQLKGFWGEGLHLKEGAVVYSTDNICSIK